MLATATVFFTPAGDRPLAAFLSVGDISPTDFRILELNPKPNQYLICPVGFCQATPHANSPEFNIPLKTLQERWKGMIEHQPRITPLPLMDPDDQLEYIQRTTLMRYPDIITVQFVKISDNKSALAIYSRSIYGRKDFGANEKRIQQWLDMLN